MGALKLLALDESDLVVISAQMQDAVTKPEAFDWAPRAQRFSLIASRFAWDAEKGGRARGHERRRTRLSFARVTRVQAQGIAPKGDDALSLLAIRFISGDLPAGTVELTFAGGAAVRLAVECIEAQMDDLGAAWETRFKPQHPAG